MSRHWHPDRSDWTVIDGYGGRGSERAGTLLLLVLPVLLGLGAAAVWLRWAG